MKHRFVGLTAALGTACLLATAAFAASPVTIAPSAAGIALNADQTTFSFDVSITSDEAFAGAEFSLKPSNADVKFQSLEFLDDVEMGGKVQGEKNGAYHFGFFTGSNDYSGEYDVARLTYTYSGSDSRTITLESSNVVTVEDQTAMGDDTAAPFTVTITRAAATPGGGTGGGGSSHGGSGGNSGSGSGGVNLETPETPLADAPFTDVPTDAYYAAAVQWAVEKGVTGGTTATTFSPDAACTRAQVAAFLWRANGSPAPTAANPFTDVPDGVYYHDAVLWAVEKGITGGTTAATFSPDAPCTRAQVVTFLHRAASSPAPAAGAGTFTDVADGAYYAAAVQWAVEKGITGGTTAATFSPDAVCTRAQVVTFLYRALGK